MNSRAGVAFGPLLGAGVALVVACSTSSGPALGGPHGGSTFALGPTPGNSAELDASFIIPDPPAPPGSIQGTPGHWTHIFYAYLDKGTIGNCADTHCHAKEMPDPSTSYKWLENEGYISSSPGLVQDGTSCLSWFGGDMPPTPKQSKDAVTEMTMWATTGALNN